MAQRRRKPKSLEDVFENVLSEFLGVVEESAIRLINPQGIDYTTPPLVGNINGLQLAGIVQEQLPQGSRGSKDNPIVVDARPIRRGRKRKNYGYTKASEAIIDAEFVEVD